MEKYITLRNIAFVILLLMTFLYLAFAFFGALIAPLAFMGFDAPGSESNPVVWIAVISVITFPVILITSVCMGWIFFAIRKYKASLVSLLLPTIYLLILITIVTLFP